MINKLMKNVFFTFLILTSCQQPPEVTSVDNLEQELKAQEKESIYKTLKDNYWYDLNTALSFSGNSVFALYKGTGHAMTTDGCYSIQYYEVQFEGELVEKPEGLFIRINKEHTFTTYGDTIKEVDLISIKLLDEKSLNLNCKGEVFKFKPKLKKKDKLHKHWVNAILRKLEI